MRILKIAMKIVRHVSHTRSTASKIYHIVLYVWLFVYEFRCGCPMIEVNTMWMEISRPNHPLCAIFFFYFTFKSINIMCSSKSDNLPHSHFKWPVSCPNSNRMPELWIFVEQKFFFFLSSSHHFKLSLSPLGSQRKKCNPTIQSLLFRRQLEREITRSNLLSVYILTKWKKIKRDEEERKKKKKTHENVSNTKCESSAASVCAAVYCVGGKRLSAWKFRFDVKTTIRNDIEFSNVIWTVRERAFYVRATSLCVCGYGLYTLVCGGHYMRIIIIIATRTAVSVFSYLLCVLYDPYGVYQRIRFVLCARRLSPINMPMCIAW